MARHTRQIIHLPEGESGRTTKLEGARAQEFAELVASGELDERKLAKAMEIGVLSIRKAFHSHPIRALIREEIEVRSLVAQAKAAVQLDSAVDSAVDDLQSDKGIDRAAARKFIRETAEGPAKPFVNQNNNITAWDPMQDEDLWQRGREFFEDSSKRIVVETVGEVLKRVDDE